MIDHAAFAMFCSPNVESHTKRKPLSPRQREVYNKIKNNDSITSISDYFKTPAQNIRVCITEIRAKGWDI